MYTLYFTDTTISRLRSQYLGRQELGAHEFSSELLGNKAAKLLHTPVILESPLLSSATEALKLLNLDTFKNLETNIVLLFIFKCMKVLIDFDFGLVTMKYRQTIN